MSTTSDRHTVVFIARRVGLANRLRALVGYQALSLLSNQRFALCWIRDDACDAEFRELFEPAGMTLLDAHDVSRLQGRADVRIFGEPNWFHEIWRRQLPAVPWLDFLDAVRISLADLQATSLIRQAVAGFSAAHRMSHAVGLHIRHTDNVDVDALRARLDPGFDRPSVSTLEGFRQVVREQVQGGTVFLATDNPRVEQAFRAEFGPALFTYPKLYTRGWESQGDFEQIPEEQPIRTTPVADALIENLLLGSCRRIVGTYYSSFSEISALWRRVDYCEVKGTGTGRNPMIDATIADLHTLTSMRSGPPAGHRAAVDQPLHQES
jgi:hypothetical protein